MQAVSWTDVEKERISDQITRQMVWGEHIMAVRWELAPNVELPVHDHVSEQLVTIEEGSVTLYFSETERFTLKKGDVLVIPSSQPHGVTVGPEGCVAVDYFSPIREDFLEGKASYLPGSGEAGTSETGADAQADAEKAYKALQEVLAESGIKVGMSTLREVPLELLGRYAFERECLSMGRLRRILGLSKQEAKDLLRQWKHGDDHSRASYEKMLKTFVMIPKELLRA
jgi:quercetin dioxygenase-like cupin family protein